MIDRLSVAHSNIEEALRMLNPLESHQDYNFKAFFFFFFFSQKGLLVLSLAVGDVIFGDVKEIPASLPSELRDFLSK